MSKKDENQIEFDEQQIFSSNTVENQDTEPSPPLSAKEKRELKALEKDKKKEEKKLKKLSAKTIAKDIEDMAPADNQFIADEEKFISDILVQDTTDGEVRIQTTSAEDTYHLNDGQAVDLMQLEEIVNNDQHLSDEINTVHTENRPVNPVEKEMQDPSLDNEFIEDEEDDEFFTLADTFREQKQLEDNTKSVSIDAKEQRGFENKEDDHDEDEDGKFWHAPMQFGSVPVTLQKVGMKTGAKITLLIFLFVLCFALSTYLKLQGFGPQEIKRVENTDVRYVLTELVSPTWRNATSFHDDLAYVSNGQVGEYINTQGKTAFMVSGYERCYPFSEKLARVARKGSSGALEYAFIDQTGQQVFGMFRKAEDFSGGYALIDGGTAEATYINSQNRSYYQELAQYAKSFADGMAAVQVKGKWGYMQNNGKVVLEPIWDDADTFSEGYAKVGKRKNGIMQYGYIDTMGRVVVALQNADIAFPVSNGLALIKQNGTWIYYNMQGKAVLKMNAIKYDCQPFREGLAAVGVGVRGLDQNANEVFVGSYGLIDKQGKMVVSPRWQNALSPSQGIMAFCQNDLWGYIQIRTLKK